jgi:GST-like protein
MTTASSTTHRAAPAAERRCVLFGSQGSGSAAIEAALAVCGVPFRLVSAASWDAGSALDELAAANPLLQIPALRLPDGSVLTESAAILIHLGLTYPEAGLLPADASARDQAIRGLVFIAANCYAAIGVIDYPERWCAAATAPMKERIRRAARQRLHAHWDVFADQFAGPGASFAGGAPGALELLAAVVSKWSGARTHLRKTRPAFLASLQRIESDPRVAAVFARHWPT